jgi:hypothetical protein
MTYKAQDKSNDRLNQRLMGQFHHLLNDIPPKEVHLSGRLYTWSNERAHPRIDRAFVSNEWDDIFAHSDLQDLFRPCTAAPADGCGTSKEEAFHFSVVLDPVRRVPGGGW